MGKSQLALEMGTIKGVLWHQGESDSSPARSALYKERLVELIERFRHDLDSPDVPFVIGQLGRFKGKPWTEGRRQVDRAHREISTITEAAVGPDWSLPARIPPRTSGQWLGACCHRL